MKTLEERVAEIEKHLGFDEKYTFKITIDDGYGYPWCFEYSPFNGGNLSINDIATKISRALDTRIKDSYGVTTPKRR